jgi:hypothetical protein
MSLIDVNNKKTKIDDYRNDLSLFAKECLTLQHPVKGTTPFIFNDYQEFFAKRIENSTFGDFLLAKRQVGKTSFLIAFALQNAILFGTSLIICASSLASGKHILQKIKNQFISLPAWLTEYIEIEKSSNTQVVFSNGASIKILPPSICSFRGESASYILFDEIVFAPNFQDLLEVVKPSVCPYGKIIAVSSPKELPDQFLADYFKK